MVLNYFSKKGLVLLAFSVLWSSCATIMNGAYQSVTVYTTEPSKIVLDNDTFSTNRNKAYLVIERKPEPINIIAFTDSITKEIEIKPKNSHWFWNNIFYNRGIGMLIDKNNNKRYEYPKNIYINSSDTFSKYFLHSQENKKDKLYLHASLPFINLLYLQPENEGHKYNEDLGGVF